jgi:hypothetical protein
MPFVFGLLGLVADVGTTCRRDGATVLPVPPIW